MPNYLRTGGSFSSLSVLWRSPTEMMFGDDLISSKFSSNFYLIDLVGFGSSLTFAYIEREGVDIPMEMQETDKKLLLYCVSRESCDIRSQEMTLVEPTNDSSNM
ncbi:hypothetical protein DY000_02004381 [Brassica cretica]|uniref:F-box associated domain-containing protein n=1 Tax=Brassica cretica TaxID=69181 RepID=A0ABQ7CB49_BRACR|nr:hypothetical protein DY000_02004381 [Brassica cretica]